MKSTQLLRMSSVICFLLAAGHTLGGGKLWSPTTSNPTLRAMRSFHFDVMGMSRSYLNFYTGFGWSLSIALIMEAVLLWQMATIARSDAQIVRPMVVVMALAAAASGIISLQFIFLVPAVFSFGIMLCLIGALLVRR